jgi:hypothetical protein
MNVYYKNDMPNVTNICFTIGDVFVEPCVYQPVKLWEITFGCDIQSSHINTRVVEHSFPVFLVQSAKHNLPSTFQ